MVTIFCCQETNSCFSWLEYASLDKQRSRRPEKIDIVFGSVEGARRRLEHTFLFHGFLTSPAGVFLPEGGHDQSDNSRTIGDARHLREDFVDLLKIGQKNIAKFCFYRKCVNQRKCGRKKRERE